MAQPGGLGQDTIVPGRVGIHLPPKNAFDFVDKPQADMQEGGNQIGGGSEPNKGVTKLKSIMAGLKKKNRVNYSNNRMQLVKLDA